MQAFGGMSDATMSHGEGWNFLQVGRFVERAYMTARILEALEVEHEPWHESQRLLEMCCASVPFAQSSHRAPEASDAVEFIALAPDFPRSLRFCTREIDAAIHRISGSPEATFTNDAERRLGACARCSAMPRSTRSWRRRRNFGANVRGEFELLSHDVEEVYFPRLPATPVEAEA